MTRGILIAGNESSLFSAAAAEAVKRVEQYAAAPIPSPFPRPEAVQPAAEQDKGKLPLQWSPGSPISARTLMVAAENRLGQINDAILVCSPPAMYRPAEALVPGEIENLVNDQIKGWFFLVRELALYFRSRQSGSLALVVPEILAGGGKDAPADLFGPSAAASFRAMAQGLLATSSNEPFQILGFSSAESGTEADFAAWFFKVLDEGNRKNSGRWHKYSKIGFFR
ncbi:hypothetical protein [Leadbettera azotonutricia]|uniref:Uncharacterized protein n=1 Tax=Leadbettera azotonutricia (strain ATCC BAA-888 / DSM 13862 / ZAS-9) TaxID=545695 RepID=F5YD24_LEAAZ|nr:hypothetical protein [Leadbettera azotonutricia]AEF80928.1 hypothetical protein TREAZ_2791 [Leadbettera azotonutricia ZAS-9]